MLSNTLVPFLSFLDVIHLKHVIALSLNSAIICMSKDRKEVIGMKKVTLVTLLLIGAVILSSCSIGNRQIGLDLVQTFDKAIIMLNGETIEGKVDNWRDFDESDVVQVTIDGTTYLTHYSNVVLIQSNNQH